MHLRPPHTYLFAILFDFLLVVGFEVRFQVAEMLFDTSLGMTIKINDQANRLFSEIPGRIVLMIKQADQEMFEKVLGKDAKLIGKTTATHELRIKTNDAEFNLNGTRLQCQWEDAIPCLMKSKD